MIVKELAVAVAALGTAMAAVRGLSIWKKQLLGTEDFNLARRVLSHAYHHARTLEQIRYPFMSAAEMDDPPADDAMRSNPIYVSYYHQMSGYRRRVIALRDVESQLQTDAVEVEVLLAPRARTSVDRLIRLGREVTWHVSVCVDAHHPRNADGRSTTRYGPVFVTRIFA